MSIHPRQRLQQNRGILDGFGHGANLVQRGGVSRHAITRDASVRGLESDTTAKGGWLTDRAAGVCT